MVLTFTLILPTQALSLSPRSFDHTSMFQTQGPLPWLAGQIRPVSLSMGIFSSTHLPLCPFLGCACVSSLHLRLSSSGVPIHPLGMLPGLMELAWTQISMGHAAGLDFRHKVLGTLPCGTQQGSGGSARGRQSVQGAVQGATQTLKPQKQPQPQTWKRSVTDIFTATATATDLATAATAMCARSGSQRTVLARLILPAEPRQKWHPQARDSGSDGFLLSSPPRKALQS